MKNHKATIDYIAARLNIIKARVDGIIASFAKVTENLDHFHKVIEKGHFTGAVYLIGRRRMSAMRFLMTIWALTGEATPGDPVS